MIFDVCWPILYLLSASSAAAYTGLHFSYIISLVCNYYKLTIKLFIHTIFVRTRISVYLMSLWFNLLFLKLYSLVMEFFLDDFNVGWIIFYASVVKIKNILYLQLLIKNGFC